MKVVMIATIFNNIYFWILIGAMVALVFAVSQQRSIKKAEANGTEKLLARTMTQSALRILISVAALFMAFRSGLFNGLGCLAGFITIRWIWLFIVIKDKKKTQTQEEG